MSLHRFRSWDLPSSSPTSIFWQVPGLSLSSVSQCSPRCYRASCSPHARSTGIPTIHSSSSVIAMASCQSRDTLVLCCFPSRCQRPPAQNNPQIPIWGECAAHQHGPIRPLKGALQLHKGLWAIHIQSNPASHKLAFTYELLVLTYTIPCTASHMGCSHHGPLWFPF